MIKKISHSKKIPTVITYIGRGLLASLLLAFFVIPVAEIRSSTLTDAYLSRFKPDLNARLVDKGSVHEMRYASKIEAAGDVVVKVSELRPEVTLSRWNGENGIKVAYDGIQAKGRRDFLSNTMKWKGDKEEMHAYPLEATSTMEDGGFEIEIELSEKPQKNTFDFRIEGAKDLDFKYQPSLLQEPLLGEICSETECIDAVTGEVTRTRAENVVGSFAVYHKEKKNHVLGKTNYGTGKLFHIFRPRIIDAEGNSVWGTMDYKNGKLTVTVPQEFLDSATYPVIVDPTFGYTSAGATTGTFENRITYEYASPSTTGTLSSISSYVSSVTTANKGAFGVLYAGTSVTDVGALIATTSVNTISVGFSGWHTFGTISGTAPTVTSGTNYYVGTAGESAGGVFLGNYDNGGGTGATFTSITYPTIPNPITGENSFAFLISTYATYVEPVATVLTQNDWRWYANANSVQPGSPLASLNATTTGVDDGDLLRLRMSIDIASSSLATGTTQFRLQYAEGPSCATQASWSDVVSTSTGQTFEPWLQHNNASAADGASITSRLISSSTILQTYEEANASATNTKAIASGQSGEWDWVLKSNGTKANTTYCFRMVESDHSTLNAYRSDSYARLTTSSSSVTQVAYRWRNDDGTEGDVTQFGTGGEITVNQSAYLDRAVAVAADETDLYFVGSDKIPGTTDSEWRIEKRNKITGALVTSFSSTGATTSNPGSSVDLPNNIVVDDTYLYVAGASVIGGDAELRLEKRNKTTGALVTAFDTDGVLQSDPSTNDDDISVVAVDDNYVYWAGIKRTGVNDRDWQIQKHDKTTGALVTAFGSSGVITHAITSGQDPLYEILVDDGFIYIVGSAVFAVGDSYTYMQKRNKVTGELVTGFGTDGAISVNKVLNEDEDILSIIADGEYLYLSGDARDQTSPDVNYSAQIEKRNIMTGALCSSTSACRDGAFDTDGVLSINIDDDHDTFIDVQVRGDYIFAAGLAEASTTDAQLWIEKRNRKTGALCTTTSACADGAFDTDGRIILNPSILTERYGGIILDGEFIYAAGQNEVNGLDNDQWHLNKFYQSDGALVETVTGQATWLASENASTTVELEQNLRLRFTLANSGNITYDQRYQLEIAPKGGAGSCEAVSSASYSAVPVSGSCGSSVACMINAGISDNKQTTPQLTSSGDFTYGKTIEDVSNKSATTTLFKNQYTELEYAFEFTAYAATSTSYCVRVTDEGAPLDTYTKVAEVRTAGSLLLRNHVAGQAADAFDTSSETNESLYAFKMTPDEESITVTDITFSLTGVKKISSSIFSNIRLFKDNDNDGQYDAADAQVGGSGVMSITGQSGTITFTTDFLATSSQNYIVVADWTAPSSGSSMTMQLLKTGVSGTGYTTSLTKRIEGGVAAIQHSRSVSGGSSNAQSSIGGDTVPGAGVVTGGNQGGGNNIDTNSGGATIGSETGFFWPTAQSGSWTNGAFLYDQTDGTYASTNAANTNTYTTFGFGIPSGNRVNGIEVKLEVSGTTAAGTVSAELSWDGGSTWTTAKTTPTLTTTDTVRSLGGASDPWGRAQYAWEVSHFDTANFRLRLTGAPSSNTVQVDAAQVRVYHETTGGGGGGGGEI